MKTQKLLLVISLSLGATLSLGSLTAQAAGKPAQVAPKAKKITPKPKAAPKQPEQEELRMDDGTGVKLPKGVTAFG